MDKSLVSVADKKLKRGRYPYFKRDNGLKYCFQALRGLKIDSDLMILGLPATFQAVHCAAAG